MGDKKLSCILLAVISFVFVLGVILIIQYVNPALYGIDSYYHIKIAHFIRDSGPSYKFIWAKYSVFETSFADKDFLFHVLVIPFTFVSQDLVVQAKVASLFFISLFLVVYFLLLRRYISFNLLCLGLLCMTLSNIFIMYSVYLRPMVLVNALLLMLVYSCVRQKWWAVFLISMAYTLSHISFPLGVILVWGIEIIRYLYTGKLNERNCIYSLLGLYAGILIHPNFPHNFFILYLNGILVPFYTLTGSLSIRFGIEFRSLATRDFFFAMFPVMAGLWSVVLISFFRKVKISFHSAVFLMVFGVFFVLSLFSLRYIYHAYPFGIIFILSFISEIYPEFTLKGKRAVVWIASGIMITGAVFTYQLPGKVKYEIPVWIKMNTHYERVARFMNKNIPPGETIFHAYWSDSPYFICFNPKDYYLVVLDPIYMYYYNNDIYKAYDLALQAKIDVYRVIKEVFNSRYVYANRTTALYYSLLEDKDNFEVLFDDTLGGVFKLREKPPEEK